MKDRAVPPECAVKVFKTSLNEFKRREEYMKGDHRLPSQGFKKHNPRKVSKILPHRRLRADLPSSDRRTALKIYVKA